MPRTLAEPNPAAAAPARAPLRTHLRNALAVASPRRSTALSLLTALWAILYFAALFTPPLLDDADATHSNAARHMALSGDWVTLQVNGIRYLEKAPLPYWLVALSFRVFGFNTFAAHLPEAVAVLLLVLLGYRWAAEAFDLRTAFYTGLGTLTATGVFLFTRVFIPEVLLSLFLCAALYLFLGALTVPGRDARRAYGMWTALALAVLTKGLVAIVFFGGTVLLYLALTGSWRQWRRLRPGTGVLLLLGIAAPWHVLAGLRNSHGPNGHGFFWYYFVNEHVLRFLGRREPRDYNKLPAALYWTLHLVWLFPWSLFVPVGLLLAFRRLRPPHGPLLPRLRSLGTQRGRTALLLSLYSTLILIFFSLSTNQEYYTFPAYMPLLLLIAAAITRGEQTFSQDTAARRWITAAHVTLTVLGAAIALALAAGLWTSRQIAYVANIGDLLAHRNVGNETLSMSHFFDLTGPSFAALRLPSILAALAFAAGPAIAWLFRQQRRHIPATVSIALTAAVFLVAAHLAFARFAPLLSSQDIAEFIQRSRAQGSIAPNTRVLVFGDQSYGSSLAFYLDQRLELVDGRSSSMLFGSGYPDAPPVFLTPEQLREQWGTGPRKLLLVPPERRSDAERALPATRFQLLESSGKILLTDRPPAFATSAPETSR